MVLCVAAATAAAQWTIQDGHTTASLRGIHSLGGGVAWASGSGGTILRTEDGGATWLHCAVPAGAEALDFRGVQGSDKSSAIVMSSGKGDLSRLYKTTDGCKTWKLVFTNPDRDGFWDALYVTDYVGLLIGDPVVNRFAIFASMDNELDTWTRFGEQSDFKHFRFEPSPYEGEAIFAASNSTLKGSPKSGIAFVTGGSRGAHFAYGLWSDGGIGGYPTAEFAKVAIPLAVGPSAGAFSFDCSAEKPNSLHQRCVAIGGDYQSADSTNGVAAYSLNGGKKWAASKRPPLGYRSAVSYDDSTKTWITVGPTGTDTSIDDGRNWRALKPGVGDQVDADKNWNALSLPFVVGPGGRIGVLRKDALGVAK
jgi:hypothetical protein